MMVSFGRYPASLVIYTFSYIQSHLLCSPQFDRANGDCHILSHLSTQDRDILTTLLQEAKLMYPAWMA
jgi:hypothetical protein